MSTNLESALWYAENGYRVFPVNGKIPLTKNGFKDASQEKIQIQEWWTHNPEAGVAVATGNGLVVIDIDDVELNKDWLYDYSKECISTTPRGGMHIWFNGEARNSVNAEIRVDVRGNGGYVVVPPSPGYDWTNGPLHISDLSPIPQDLLDYVQPKKTQEVKTNDSGDVMHGGRNNYLTQVAGALQRKGLSYEALTAALSAENEARCNPPLSDQEVATIAKSVSRYTPEDPITADAAVPSLQSVLKEMESNNGSLVHVASLGEAMVSYLSDKEKVKGLATGLPGLDKLLGGGKRLGEVTCWHAEAKTGKNTLWHYLMHDMLERGVKIAYASRELSPAEEVIPNLLSIAFKENSWLADMSVDQRLRYTSRISSWPLYFASGYGHFPSEAIIRWVTEAKAQGIEYFWFDHLHYMLEDPEDHKAASKLIKELKALAKSLSIHIDIIIQPNKLMDGQRLSLNSIKGGAAMGQAIDNLLILERVKGVQNVSKLTLEVARSKLARLGNMYLQFDPETTMFAETEQEEPQATPTPSPIVARALSAFNPVLTSGQANGFRHQF